MRATKVKMELELIVERPDKSLPINVIDLSEWVSDQLGRWITLPFDSDTRMLMEITIDTFDDGTDIAYEETQ